MFKRRLELFVRKAGKLQGDPHYIALGMAIGVFVAITPTIPFHTVLAVVMAYVLKASKPAAVIGVWVSNPVTVVFLYFACYKTGFFIFGQSYDNLDSIRILIQEMEGGDNDLRDKLLFFKDFIKTQVRVFIIMNIGGVVLGAPSGIITYLLTKKVIAKIRRQKR